MNITALLKEQARKHPEKTAFVFRGEEVSFRELKDKVFSAAAALSAHGIVKGDRVALYLPGCPEYILSYLAVWVLGATAVPLDFMLTSDELLSCLGHCEAKTLIMREKAVVSACGLKEKLPALSSVFVCNHKDTVYPSGVFPFKELPEKDCAISGFPVPDDSDPAIIFYTSGTTGKPKGVIVNYRQLEAPPKAMEYFVELSGEDIALCALPFSHLGGLIYIQGCLVYSLTFVLMERFIPAEFLKIVQERRITCFWIVPSMYYALLQLKEFESFDLSSLRWVVTFGASSSPEALRRFQKFCPGAQLLNGWGMTETNAPTVVLPRGSAKIESVGRPAPWVEICILDENDKPAQAGAVGEVAVRGWVVTDGYFKDPELTAESMRGGWFHTGDLGRIDAEGDLFIVGRKKEMIKVGGEIVFEPEVESVLLRHPAVAEAAVVGVPDKLRGEIPRAWVVLKQDAAVSAEDLRYFCREHLARFKIPQQIEFLPALPKNRSGKNDKERLRPQPAGN